ncbi:MAG: sensor histidine kinase/response regulator [Phenylobacterium sp.]|nr:sensor histidine kinase/response regulator [Phenylobacterium sp.]
MATALRPTRGSSGDVDKGSRGLSRNLIIQLVGVTFIGLALAHVASWLWVAPWVLGVLGSSWIEDRLFSRVTANGGATRRLVWTAIGVRLLSSALWAWAALALIAKGDPAERLLAFALLAVSMVNVLMRYYHSRVVFVIGITPHLAVLSLVAWDLTGKALAGGDLMTAMTPAAVVILFGVLFWASRAQLADTWTALLKATAEAREGERVAREASLAKSNFLATMGHELRTPLNGMLGMAQAMAMAGSLSDEQRAQLKVIRRSGESLAAVLNDLLDLSKIEAGELELEVTEFDLEHLARGVIAIFSHQAEKKGLTFNFAIEEAAKGRYRGDSARVRQVLYNLFSNAVKFTDTGAIAFTVDRQGGEIVLRVDDTGIGIAPENLALLFESFFQADASNTRRYCGAGLGLTICQELMTLMGGKIVAASELGEGSTFTVTIPLERIADVGPLAAPEPEAPAPSAEEPGEVRVLAAEDNEVNQLVLKTLLSQAGVTPTLVADGAQAVAAWEREPWDIILMDIQMPEMDGVQATREIRRREAETGRARTPILAVTANAMVHQVAAYEAAGMDGVVPKPIELARLFAAMEAALAGETAGQGEDLRAAS